ncbi:tripartite tricarboxylate transporter substrate binding protein [Aquincola sp. MAHUQ-54]|uniref:Tripartite tricarboxylate transporter substrate binding protein n=1 Tax=Aquincola agrisoli TaxID=3119538 RepID=A0AAW9QCQ9_9BURK
MDHGFLTKTGTVRRAATATAVAALAGGLALGAWAQGDYPTKPVELNVMFPAGSSADVVARLLADGMAKHLGQPVVVNNRPGAGGAIAYKYVQAQKPDGYTLVFNSNSVSTVYYSGLTPFDYKAFDSIARVTIENPVIAVKADSPWKDLKELVAHAKQKPGELRLGNSGTGSHTHITAVAFFGDQKAEPLHVPFAAAQVVTSLLGGHIDALVQLPSALAPHVRAGTLRIVGVLASKRDPAFPGVPTAIEQGFDFQADMWRGVAAPRGTPPAVLARLEKAIQKTVDSPEFKAQGEKNGYIAAFQPASEFNHTIATEDALLAKLMTRVGMKQP